jgi:hypothetical protein
MKDLTDHFEVTSADQRKFIFLSVVSEEEVVLESLIMNGKLKGFFETKILIFSSFVAFSTESTENVKKEIKSMKKLKKEEFEQKLKESSTFSKTFV